MSSPDAPHRPTVLVVDDEPSIRESLRMALRREFDVETAGGGTEALASFQQAPPDAVLLDIMMPEMDGITLLEKLKALQPEAVVIMLTAITSVKTVVEAMRRGADDYIAKPFDLGEVRLVIEKALERRELRAELRRLRSALQERYGFDRLVGRSKAMRAVYDTIEQISDRRATVLVRGESGTGKELVARAIHFTGPRKDKPFVVVNCAAIPETLIESELFGYEKGAFTDARDRKVGHFEAANGGTILLDEIGELALAVQAKLLRVLQEREFTRVGGTAPVKVDVRVIAATNKDLERAIDDGSFRKDLYYRINVVPIVLPPLSERREDIPFLVEHFLARYAEPGQDLTVAPEAMEALTSHDWPGNVRELENTIERLAALATDSVIRADQLPTAVIEGGRVERLRSAVLEGKLAFEQAIEQLERDIIEEALRRSAGVQTRAADLLGVSRRILKYKMDKYGLA